MFYSFYYFNCLYSRFLDHDLPASNWITLGLDDSHLFDTLPFNVTQDFETVMRLASSKKVLDPNQHEHFYFKNDECASERAIRKFEEVEGEGDDKEEEEEPCDCGCEEATEEEKWEEKVQGMEMQWTMMAVFNQMQSAFEAEDDMQMAFLAEDVMLKQMAFLAEDDLQVERFS